MAVHGKDATALMDTLALTGALRGWDSGTSVDLADVSAMGDEGKRYLPGLESAGISFDGLFTDFVVATPGIDTALDTARATAAAASVVTLAPNGMALGARVISASAYENQYTAAAPVGDAVGFASAWASDGQVDTGVSLLDLTALSATGNGTGVDQTAGTTNGASGAVHVTANTRNGTCIVKVQHSTDNSSWADLITFTTIATSTKTAERLSVTGTVNRYLRAQWTVAGSTGSLTVAVAACRR